MSTGQEQPTLSVLMATYNGAHVVGEQLEALAQQEWDGAWEVVVADNGSTDTTREVVESYRGRVPALRVLDAADQPGKSGALNAAAAVARGQYFAFLDQDDVVAPGWLAAMVEALGRSDMVGARMDHTALNRPWTVAHRGHPQSDGLPALPGARFHHSWGCAIGVRREWHERIGGSDPDCGGAEDIDYCWRVQDAGGVLTFAPDAVVHYRHKTTLREIFRQSAMYARDTMYVLSISRDAWGSDGPSAAPASRARKVGALLGRLPIPPSRARVGQFVWFLGEKVGLVRSRRR